MTPELTVTKTPVVPRTAVMLPVAYLIHLAEEWFGGFSEWTLAALGNEVSPERFIVINATAFLIFAGGTLVAFKNKRMAWIVVSLAALLGLNGVLHSLATVGFGSYSPGTITGLLLYIPLSVIVLRSLASQLSRGVFAGSVVLGFALHGLVALFAFL